MIQTLFNGVVTGLLVALPALAPGAMIVLAVVSFSLLGEGLAERITRREQA